MENCFHKKVLLVGAGPMGEEYCLALKSLGKTDVTVVANTNENLKRISERFGFKTHSGGVRSLTSVKHFDLCIVCVPVLSLKSVTDQLVKKGATNILVEKPGCLFSEEMKVWALTLAKIKKLHVRICTNRLAFPSFHAAKKLIHEDGGATSCSFSFTEWTDQIITTKYPTLVLDRWGIANSIHLIGMAFSLIGMPERISCFRSGSVSWHPSGSSFAGAGMSKEGVPFTYHADWGSAGRWSLDVATRKRLIRLCPIETVTFCNKNSLNFQVAQKTKGYEGVKPGLSEALTSVLSTKSDLQNLLPTPSEFADLIQIVEKICGYKSQIED